MPTDACMAADFTDRTCLQEHYMETVSGPVSVPDWYIREHPAKQRPLGRVA